MINDKEHTRAEERVQENIEYTPVIIKRSDFVVRHPDDVLQTSIEEGFEQYQRSTSSLFLSSIAAGLILGFAAMAVAFAFQLTLENSFTGMTQRLIVALFYPLGFIVCTLSGTQLFTEHTATAVYPVLDKKVHFLDMLKLWTTILMGNITGTLISSILISFASASINLNEGYVQIAHHFTNFSSFEIFMSAVLAGWLMAQGGWLILATPPNIAQIVCVYIVTFLIGIGGLHHSIVGSAELFSAYLAGSHIEVWDICKILLLAALGNLFGGSIFVGLLNYAHIRKV